MLIWLLLWLLGSFLTYGFSVSTLTQRKLPERGLIAPEWLLVILLSVCGSFLGLLHLVFIRYVDEKNRKDDAELFTKHNMVAPSFSEPIYDGWQFRLIP